MTTRRLLSILLLPLLLSSCGLLPEQIDETKDWSANKFYAEASASMAENDYDTAIEYYEKLEARYPFGRYAMQAQLDVAYAHYKNEEPELAIAAADRFIKLHPTNPYVDYAYYLKGIVNFNRSVGFFDRFIPVDSSQRDPGAAADSFKDFSELIRKFPDSPYSADAMKRLIHLRNNMAKYQVHVARYYMRRGAYLAAVNRCIDVVENYQRTFAVEEALEIMIEAYDKMGMETLSKDAQRVLALNRQNGTFNTPVEPEIKPLSRKIWEYLELDRN